VNITGKRPKIGTKKTLSPSLTTGPESLKNIADRAASQHLCADMLWGLMPQINWIAEFGARYQEVIARKTRTNGLQATSANVIHKGAARIYGIRSWSRLATTRSAGSNGVVGM
jgi:hypothetical protein